MLVWFQWTEALSSNILTSQRDHKQIINFLAPLICSSNLLRDSTIRYFYCCIRSQVFVTFFTSNALGYVSIVFGYLLICAGHVIGRTCVGAWLFVSVWTGLKFLINIYVFGYKQIVKLLLRKNIIKNRKLIADKHTRGQTENLLFKSVKMDPIFRSLSI